MNNKREKSVYSKPVLKVHDSVERLTKAWNTGSEDGMKGDFQT